MDKQKGRGRFVFFCVAPATILFFIFVVFPTINVFRMSLYKWGGFSANKTFIGFENFQNLMNDKKFFQSFQNTVLIIALVTIITIVFSLVFAGILVRAKMKFKNFFRVIFYIPNILSMVVISAVFSAIFDQRNGLLNGILSLITGKEVSISWLGNQKIVIFSIVIVLIWQAIGYYMVMYMSSMSAIPESLYECADLEGVSPIRQFFTITLPLIWVNIRTTLSFFVISSINMSFLLVQALTQGNPDGATEVFLSYMYKQAYTNGSYGYGMAIGVIVFTFSFGLSALINAVTKRDVIEF